MYFERIYIPSNQSTNKLDYTNQTNFVFELNYDNQKHHLDYPMSVKEPFAMKLNEPFKREKNEILLIVLLKEEKKYRKIAKGKINLYKKNLLEEQFLIEKFISLELYQIPEDIEQIATPVIETVSAIGKVFMKAQFIDPPKDDLQLNLQVEDLSNIFSSANRINQMTKILRKFLRGMKSQKNAGSNVPTGSNRFKSISSKELSFLKNNVHKKYKSTKHARVNYDDISDKDSDDLYVELRRDRFDDGLSDISAEEIEELSYFPDMDYMNEEIDQAMNKLVVEYENRADELLPNDSVKEEVINDLYSSVNTIVKSYEENLHSITEVCKSMKSTAKEYYEKYKEVRRKFEAERKGYTEQLKAMTEVKSALMKENKKVNLIISEEQKEKVYISKKMGLRNTTYVDEDIDDMIDILNTLKHDNNVYDGLSDCEKEILKNVLSRYSEPHIDEKNLYDYIEIADHDTLQSRIEELIGMLSLEKKISVVKVRKETETLFEFNSRPLTLYIDGSTIMVKDQNIALEKWLIENFPHIVEEIAPKSIEARKSNYKSIKKK